jgi:hypothetical protein
MTSNITMYWCFRKFSLDMTKPSQNSVVPTSLKLILPKFVPFIIVSDLISPCVAEYPIQYSYFNYSHLLNMLSFCNPIFYVVHHRGHCPIELD